MSGTATPTARATLIYNEQTKLLANALDRASTALGVGAIFPLVGLIKPADGHLNDATVFLFSAAFLVLAFWSGVLHYTARRVLRGLR
jgi:hypothetical protein